VVLQEGHVLGDAVVKRLVVLLGVRDRDRLRRKLRVLQLLHREEGPRTSELALHQSDLFRPRVRHELDVLQVPVVVLDADAGRAGLRRRLRLEPFGEVVGGGFRLVDVGLESRVAASEFAGELREIGALPSDGLRPVVPDVLLVARQVVLRLREQSRHRLDSGAHLRGVGRGERELVAPDLDGAQRERSLARRLVALLVEHRDVEAGIVDPGLQDPVVEVEAVQLGADNVVVDLLRNRPAARIDRREALAIRLDLALLRGHCSGAVIRHPVDDLRFLERPEVLEESDEVVVARAARRIGRRVRGASADERSDEQTGSHQERRIA
jgi:hypothetical protein